VAPASCRPKHRLEASTTIFQRTAIRLGSLVYQFDSRHKQECVVGEIPKPSPKRERRVFFCQSRWRKPADPICQQVTVHAPTLFYASPFPFRCNRESWSARPRGSFGFAPEGLKKVAQGKPSGVVASATLGCRRHTDSNPVGVAQRGTGFLEPLQGSCSLPDLISQGGVRLRRTYPGLLYCSPTGNFSPAGSSSHMRDTGSDLGRTTRAAAKVLRKPDRGRVGYLDTRHFPWQKLSQKIPRTGNTL
jgi:hypothetical protein